MVDFAKSILKGVENHRMAIAIISIIVIIVILMDDDIMEAFRGRGRRGHRGGGRGYLHHHRRRNWPGRRGWWGRGGNRVVYTAPIVYGGWYNPSWYNPWSYWGGPCKDGCTSIGNGEWGCQSPGNQVNDCLFASDCRGCDRNRDVKRAEHKGWGWW